MTSAWRLLTADATKPPGSPLKGITRIDVDDSAKEARVSGDPELVAQFKQMAALLDVAPKRCELHVRILRYSKADFSSRGVPEVISLGTAMVNNNGTASLVLLGAGQIFGVLLQPHVNGVDGNINLGASLKSYFPSEAPQFPDGEPTLKASDRVDCILESGKPGRVTGVTSAGDAEIQRKVREAKEVLISGAPVLSTFFLEVTAKPIPPIPTTPPH